MQKTITPQVLRNAPRSGKAWLRRFGQRVFKPAICVWPVLLLALGGFTHLSASAAFDTGNLALLKLAAVGNADQYLDTRFPPPKPQTIRKAQSLLKEQGFYHGDIDGRLGPGTSEAIGKYQKSSGLKVDGLLTPDLLKNLESNAKVSALLNRLKITREKKIQAARAALLNNPETRALAQSMQSEDVADPTRDPSKCFANPTTRCLLIEAFESATAVFKPEMRDWAFGEVLVTQANAGLATDAMASVRRMHDPRLIMVALRDIARGQAQAGNNKAALDFVDIIPDKIKQVEAYVAIAHIQAERDDKVGARETALHAATYLKELDDDLRAVTARCQIAIALHKVGFHTLSERTLADAEKSARAQNKPSLRDSALRHIAAALAETGQTARAVTLLREVKNDQEHVPVLMAAATSQAESGATEEALITADAIEAVRYRAIVLSAIAATQAKEGKNINAVRTIEKAISSTASIKMPYARAYAQSRIALALNDIAAAAGHDADLHNRSVEIASDIKDDQLRAKILWTLANMQRRANLGALAHTTLSLAQAAIDEIKSPLSQVWVWGDIALANLDNNESESAWHAFDKGFAIARAIKSPWSRARALARTASILNALHESSVPQAK